MASRMDHDDANMAQREAEKLKAISAIAEALNLVEYRDGMPDAWERACLGHALAAVFSGFYDLAAGEAQLAIQASNKRSRRAQSTLTHAFDVCDLAFFSNALELAQLEPVKRYPRLGPIDLK